MNAINLRKAALGDLEKIKDLSTELAFTDFPYDLTFAQSQFF